MIQDKTVTVDAAGCVWWFLLIIVLVLLTSGDPDLLDALTKYVLSLSECQ